MHTWGAISGIWSVSGIQLYRKQPQIRFFSLKWHIWLHACATLPSNLSTMIWYLIALLCGGIERATDDLSTDFLHISYISDNNSLVHINLRISTILCKLFCSRIVEIPRHFQAISTFFHYYFHKGKTLSVKNNLAIINGIQIKVRTVKISDYLN